MTAIVCLTVVCVAQAAALAYGLRLFGRHVRESEQTTALERATLLTRIQAPEAAAAQSLAPSSPDERAVHPDLPEQYWDAIDRYRELDRGA